MGQADNKASTGSKMKTMLKRRLSMDSQPQQQQLPLPKPAKLKGHPGMDSLEDNPWQLEYPDKDEVGSIIFHSQPRRWLHVDKRGSLEYRTVDRQDMVHELNISYRDVRILDPLVAEPYPTALLIRERALVVNIEAVRMIICKDQCFVLSVPNPHVPGTTGMFPAADCQFVHDLVSLIKKRAPNHTYSQAASEWDEALPYELRALEAALQATGRSLSGEVSAMEQRAIPALARLMQKLSDQELESMRVTKAALTSLINRVSKVRQELEETLDDDQEMLDMYLGRRARQEQAAAMRRASVEARQSRQSADGSPPPQQPRQPQQQHDSGTRHQPKDTVSHEQDGRSQQAAGPEAQHSQDVFGEAERRQHGDSPFGAAAAASHNGNRMPHSSSATANTTASSAQAQGQQPQQRSAGMADWQRDADDLRSGNVRRLQHSVSAPVPVADLLARLQAARDSGIAQDLTVEDLAAAGIYALTRNSLDGPTYQSGRSPPNPRDISECEGLLEVYFKQSDDLLRRLITTRARIADTEAAIEVLLDQRRNGLVALTLVVNSIMLAFALVAMVVGAFGMNYNTWMAADDIPTSKRHFLYAFLVPSAVAGLLFLAVMLYARWKRLLWIPETVS